MHRHVRNARGTAVVCGVLKDIVQQMRPRAKAGVSVTPRIVLIQIIDDFSEIYVNIFQTRLKSHVMIGDID